jgi:hypothetical protein
VRVGEHEIPCAKDSALTQDNSATRSLGSTVDDACYSLCMPIRMRRFPLLFVFVLSAASILLGAKGQLPRGTDSRDVALPQALDPRYRHAKGGEIELTVFGATYLGASTKKSWLTGARAYYHLNAMFALGTSYGYQWIAVDRFHTSSAPLRNRHTHFINAEVAISNDVAMRFGSTVLELDLFMTLGAGALRLDGHWEMLGVIGGGLKAYTGVPWLALRIDVNNYLHRVRKPAGDTVDMDISFALGLSALLPHPG